MGGWFSSESSEAKAVDNNGEVVNSITINSDQPIVIVCAVFLALAKLVEMISYFYREHKKSLKKKYQPSASGI